VQTEVFSKQYPESPGTGGRHLSYGFGADDSLGIRYAGAFNLNDKIFFFTTKPILTRYNKRFSVTKTGKESKSYSGCVFCCCPGRPSAEPGGFFYGLGLNIQAFVYPHKNTGPCLLSCKVHPYFISFYERELKRYKYQEGRE